MKEIFNYFFVCILILTLPLKAQEYDLTLYVTDFETGKPLSSLTVLINSSSGSGITSSEGVFSTSLPEKEYTLSLEYTGYKNKQLIIDLKKDTLISVKMNVFEEQLSEVVVLAKKMNENVETPQMGVFNITAKELVKIPSAFGEFDVLKSITLMAGVNNAGDVSNGISVRGGSLDQNLMLYDSAPVFNPTHLFGLLSVFTPDVISNVSMYQANIPSKYGGRISSVMDIKVKNPYVNKLKISGGIGLLSSRINLTTPLIKDKLFLLAGARAGFTDILFPIFVKRLENTKANFSDGTVKLLYLLNEDNQLSYTYFKSNDFYQLDLISTIENINAKSNQYDFGTSNHTLSWIYNFKNNTSLKSSIIHSIYSPMNLFPENDSDNVITFKSNVKYISAQTEFVDIRNEKLDYSIGLQTKNYIIEPGSLFPGKGNSITPITLNEEVSIDFSTYFNLNWNPQPNLSISAGLRHTIFNFLGPYDLAQYNDSGYQTSITSFDKNKSVISYNNLEPRLGASIKIGENSSLKASYARINQYIQNIYNTSTPLPTSRWKTSDFYIKPQLSDTFGFGFFQNFNSLGLEFSAESYYRSTNNTLTYKPGADFFLAEFIERELIQGKGRNYGLEITLKKPSGKLSGFINYTWARSLLKTDEQQTKNKINSNKWYPSEFDRPHTFNATLSYESDLYNEYSFNFTAQSGRPYTIANGVFELGDLKVPIYLERNNAVFPTYHRLDFSWKISYSKVRNTRLKGDWIFTLYNLYGRKNPFNIYYAPRDGTSDNGLLFGSSPFGAYDLSIINSAIISLTYNFVFN